MAKTELEGLRSDLAYIEGRLRHLRPTAEVTLFGTPEQVAASKAYALWKVEHERVKARIEELEQP